MAGTSESRVVVSAHDDDGDSVRVSCFTVAEFPAVQMRVGHAAMALKAATALMF